MAGTTEYKNQWQKDNVDRVNLVLPKGDKVRIREHAVTRGESVNGFIKRAIDNQIEKDNAEG